jgi:hypothetical protein
MFPWDAEATRLRDTVRGGATLAEMDAACEHWLAMRRRARSYDADVMLGCCNSSPAPGPTPHADSYTAALPKARSRGTFIPI